MQFDAKMWQSKTSSWDANPFSLDNWISNCNTDITSDKKPAHICFHSKISNIITEMNVNKNMNSTITG